MPLIILGVLVFGGLLALFETIRNKKHHTASSKGKADEVAPVIYLPTGFGVGKEKKTHYLRETLA